MDSTVPNAALLSSTQGGLTTAQLNIIFSNVKSAPKWSDLGSKCKAYTTPIKITGPDPTSGTSTFFAGAVFTGTQTFRSSYTTTANADFSLVLKTIQSDGDYVAFMGYGNYVKNKSTLTAAAIKNSAGAYVLPSNGSIGNGTYKPLARYLYMNLLSKSVANTKAYIQYALSSAGSAIVASSGYVPLSSTVIKQMLARVGA
jgi:phosphate transport system substrate-binding protein